MAAKRSTGTKRVESTKARAAATTNLAKARAAHPKGAQTSKQLAAEHANLAKARAAHPKGAQTARQLAADRANLVKSRAIHSAGSLTARQLAADRLNGKKAGLAMRRHNAVRHLAQKAARHDAVLHLHSLRAGLRAPLGDRLVRHSLKHQIAQPRLTGTPRKFVSRLSPSPAAGTTTRWGKSHSHKFKKRLHSRKPRSVQIGHWRRTRKRVTPR